jgi:hypothetical protein
MSRVFYELADHSEKFCCEFFRRFATRIELSLGYPRLVHALDKMLSDFAYLALIVGLNLATLARASLKSAFTHLG